MFRLSGTRLGGVVDLVVSSVKSLGTADVERCPRKSPRGAPEQTLTLLVVSESGRCGEAGRGSRTCRDAPSNPSLAQGLVGSEPGLFPSVTDPIVPLIPRVVLPGTSYTSRTSVGFSKNLGTQRRTRLLVGFPPLRYLGWSGSRGS